MEMAENKALNEVREIREKLGVTQRQLAEMLGVAEKTVQNWEYGKTIPKTKHQKLRELIMTPPPHAGGGMATPLTDDGETEEMKQSSDNVSILAETVRMQQQSLMKSQEQIDRLLEIIGNLTNN